MRIPLFLALTGVVVSSAAATPSTPPAVTFGPGVGVTAGSIPVRLLLADVNADQRPDLLASGSAAAVTLRLAQSGGGFGTQTPLATGSTPAGIAVADVTGDGAPDMVTGNGSNAKSISVIKHNDDGSWAAHQDYAVGKVVYDLALADTDGDGDRDAVTANYDDKSLSIQLNDGHGTFSAPTAQSFGSWPSTVQVTDVNADGRMDLLATNGYGVAVRLALPGGGYGLEDDYTGASGAFGLAPAPNEIGVADLNGDRRPDLVTSNFWGSGKDVTVYLNNGSGFATGVEYSVSTGSTSTGFPNGLVVADFNGDGHPDVATTNNGQSSQFGFQIPGGISVLLGRGDGTLSPGGTPLSSNAARYGIAAADVTDDGRFDLAVTTASDNNVTVLPNASRASYAAAPATSASTAFAVPVTITGFRDAIATVELWAKGPQDAAFAKVATGPAITGGFNYQAAEGDGDYGFYAVARNAAGTAFDVPTAADSTTHVAIPAATATATVTATATAIAATPTPTATPTVTPRPRQILVTLGYDYKAFPRQTRLFSLTVKNVPRGATVTASCRKGCVRRSFSVHGAKRSQVALTPLVAKKPLKVGTTITVSVTQAGAIGALKTLTIRPRKPPRIGTACLRPGTTTRMRCGG